MKIKDFIKLVNIKNAQVDFLNETGDWHLTVCKTPQDIEKNLLHLGEKYIYELTYEIDENGYEQVVIHY